MAERYETPPEYPVRLHIQTISYCNAHCLFCAYPAVADTIFHGIMEMQFIRKSSMRLPSISPSAYHCC